MCGYSITWKPRSKVAPPVRATAFTENCPGVTAPVGATVNRTVCASSARSKRTCADGGVARPALRHVERHVGLRRTGRVVGHGRRESRAVLGGRRRVARALRPGAAVGTITISGVDRTDSAGTTSSSIRFSPLKMLPS